MRKLLMVAMLTLTGCGACANKIPPVADVLPGIPFELDPSLSVATRTIVLGHACPVNGYVLTASHVVYDEHFRQYLDVSWSDGYHNEGFAAVSAVHSALDISFLSMYEGDSPVYLPAGDATVGDKVFWFEYDFRTQKNAMRARRRFAYIIREVAHYYVLDESPVSGASGTCLINKDGQVVGIINASWETEDGRESGFASRLPDLPELP